jgi:hypothetical protein
MNYTIKRAKMLIATRPSGISLDPRSIVTLGRTKLGQPRHPSRLAYATPLEDF